MPLHCSQKLGERKKVHQLRSKVEKRKHGVQRNAPSNITTGVSRGDGQGDME